MASGPGSGSLYQIASAPSSGTNAHHLTLLCAHAHMSKRRGGPISFMVLCRASQPPSRSWNEQQVKSHPWIKLYHDPSSSIPVLLQGKTSSQVKTPSPNRRRCRCRCRCRCRHTVLLLRITSSFRMGMPTTMQHVLLEPCCY